MSIFVAINGAVAASLADRRGLRRAPNKSKQIQTIPRKKAWISLDSLGRFGAFQWLTANPSKKILSLSPALETPLSPRPLRPGAAIRKILPSISAIDKKRRASCQ
jgi:hypothetical protein